MRAILTGVVLSSLTVSSAIAYAAPTSSVPFTLHRNKIMFDALADQCQKIERVGPAVRLRHSWINGIKEMQVKLT